MTEVFSRTDKLNPSRMCSLFRRQRSLLRGWPNNIEDNSQETVRSQLQGQDSTEEPVTKTVKNQTTNHWFMCYQSVKWINGAQPSERTSKSKCQTSIHKFFVALPQETCNNILLETKKYVAIGLYCVNNWLISWYYRSHTYLSNSGSSLLFV
jgi:hypothetical protein